MRKITGIVIFVLGVAVVSLFLYQRSNIPRREDLMAGSATVLFVKGDVRYMTSGGERWLRAEPGTPLLEGYRMRTGGDSWAEVVFEEGPSNAVKIYGNTTVDFESVGPVELGLLDGKIRSLVEGLKEGSDFKVKTPTATCGVRGTGWDTRTDGQEVIVEVHESKVYLTKLPHEGYVEESTIVDAGKRALVSGPAKPITIEDLPPGAAADWMEWKRDLRDRLKPAETAAAHAPGGPAASNGGGEGKKVWVEEDGDGDFRLMVNTEGGDGGSDSE